MRLALHPLSRSQAHIDVELVQPSEGGLVLHYAVTGDVDGVLWPAPASPARGDGLWKHTCFEIFIRPDGASAYVELNFSPTTQWAAYAFDDYRTGMRDLTIDPPHISANTSAGRFELSALIGALALPAGAPLRIGLSAIVEDASGELSYWALAHPPGKPDFHHSDCFALEITPSERP